MSANASASASLDETAWIHCESVIRRFEDAWREHGRPDLESFLDGHSPHQVRLLVELVHVDLEFRLRSGEDARTEDYISRFPDLTRNDRMLDLIAAEFALRNRHRPPVWPEEFWLRFPEHLGTLRKLLPDEGRPGLLTATRPAPDRHVPLTAVPSITGYAIEDVLGRGGMGVVYKARDLILNRTVAIKTLGSLPRAENSARFAREAESIARLDHPHIVPVYEVGEWQSGIGSAVPFFVMKWYAGGNLEATASGPKTDHAAHARTVETIARAVHHAHQRGVLHRDLKPSNILLDEAGRPHVADFGLAGRFDPVFSPALGTDSPAPAAADLETLSGSVVGTPAYMAPEQARSPKQLTTAADVYGLGAILYQLLTGHPPFRADTPLATLHMVTTGAPDRPSIVNPAVPRDLETICLKCLEKEPTRRYASAAELADDLERWRCGLPVLARPTPAWERGWRWVRRHPVVTGMALVTLASVVALIVTLAEMNARIREKEREIAEAYKEECAKGYKLQESLAREQRSLYLERVTSAGRLYGTNQLPHAWRLLDECPESLRGWEWRYLDSLRRSGSIALDGHTAWIGSATFLPDGRLVTADLHANIRVWDVASGTEQRAWRSGRSSVVVSAHPSRNWFVAADREAVAVWDADTGKEVAKLKGLFWAAFSPDGTRVATSDGPLVRLWTVPDWKPAGELRGHTDRVMAGAFSPDSKRLVTSSLDHTIRNWDLESGTSLEPRSVSHTVSDLAFTSDGQLLAESHIGAVLLTDPMTGELRDRIDIPAVGHTSVATGPDPHTVALSGAQGKVVIWDCEHHRIARMYRGHTAHVSALAFSRDGQRLASGGGDLVVRVWDPTRELGVRTLADVGRGAGGLAVAPDGSRVAVGPRFMGPTRIEPLALVLDATTGQILHRLPAGTDVVFHPDSRRLVAGRLDGGVTIWDSITGAELRNLPFPSPREPRVVVAPGGRRLTLSPDGSRVAIWDLRAGGVQVWATDDGTPLATIDVGVMFVYALAFTPDGSRVVVTTQESVKVWDIATGTAVPWGDPGRGAFAVALSPDGAWMATADHDRVVRLREAATGKVIRTFVGSPMRVNTLAFSPDGSRLVSGGSDQTVRVWDVASGQEVISLPGLSEAVVDVAWIRPGDRIFALDQSVRVWQP